MGEVVRRIGGELSNETAAGSGTNAGKFDWYPFPPGTWWELKDMPKPVRDKFVANGLYPNEVHLFHISGLEAAEVRGVPGFVKVTGYIIGDNLFSKFELTRPEDGGPESWTLKSEVRKFDSASQAKRFDAPADLSNANETTSAATAEVGIPRGFTDAFRSLPTIVRRRLVDIRDADFVLDDIRHVSEDRPAGVRGEETYTVRAVSASSSMLVAVEAEATIQIPEGAGKSVAKAALATATWSVKMVRGAFR